MMSEFKSKVISLVAILGILVLLFSLPSLLVGHVIDSGKVPDLQGDWEITSVISFNQVQCQADPSTPRDAVSGSIFIDQSEERLGVVSSKFLSSDGKVTFVSRSFNMKFLSENKLSGDAAYTSSRGGEMLQYFTEITLSNDCNSGLGLFTWTYGEDGIIGCDGNGEFTMRRKNPTGCGIKCSENWTCSDWGNCNNGTQIRLCADINNCKESTRPSESRTCQLPAPIIPEKSNSLWIYLIIILAILVAAAGVILVRNQLMKKKGDVVRQLEDGIEKINLAVSRGDKLEAMNQYKMFGEKFTESKPFIKEEDYNKLYEEVLKAYNRIVQLNSSF